MSDNCTAGCVITSVPVQTPLSWGGLHPKKNIYTYIKSGCERINCQALEKESIKAEPLENWNWQRKSTEIQEMLLVLLRVCLPFSGSWPGRANVRCGTHRWNKWKMIYRYLHGGCSWIIYRSWIFMDFPHLSEWNHWCFVPWVPRVWLGPWHRPAGRA